MDSKYRSLSQLNLYVSWLFLISFQSAWYVFALSQNEEKMIPIQMNSGSPKEGIASSNTKSCTKGLSMNFKLLGQNGKEVSVHHRIGHACDDCEVHGNVIVDENALIKTNVDKDNRKFPKKQAENSIYNEPFPGMVLHVSQDDSDNAVEKRSSGDVNIYHNFKPCCPQINNKTNMKSASEPEKQYELVEVLRDDLGTTDIHNHDFAYRPVVALPSSAHERWKEDEYWWDNNFHMHNQHDTDYEKLGERAFAGGSHGEVWKAKRRCHQLSVNFGQRSARDFPNEDRWYDYNHRRLRTLCNEDEMLIMKRLKVGKSYELMEAGLREIYFGDILSRNEESSSLFTTYIDHFFHQKHNDVQELELWIVFRDAGSSLRSYLYSPLTSGDFVVYQHSAFWTRLRTGELIRNANDDKSTFSSVALVNNVQWSSCEDSNTNPGSSENQTADQDYQEEESDTGVHGKDILKSILKQLLRSSAKLHERGIVHRDIKPSNIMCRMDDSNAQMNCVLGDFSSAYDEFSAGHLYSHGPSRAEQTDEYAPPEVLFGTSQWVPFDELKPESYDSWSIGVVILEMLLGTPLVFSVDKRTTAVLTRKLKDEKASDEDIRRALYLAALSQFCIYLPTSSSDKNWPLREGDPLFRAPMAKTTCTIQDFHNALRARDPLGLGFSDSMNPLLQLIWGLLAWNPKERLTAADALKHYYFTSTSDDGQMTALEPQMLDPRLDLNMKDKDPHEFSCPKCGRVFNDLQSCQMHATNRKHAKFCSYNREMLPKCLNAHSMLPAHPTSGYCDIQGRRRTIEDFHTVHLHDTHQFFGVFDGHNSNFASKYASSALYKRIVGPLSDVDDDIKGGRDWKKEVESEMTDAFNELHEGFLEAMKNIPSNSMRKAGTTATALFVTENAVIIASVGDSRAVLSLGASFHHQEEENTNAFQLTVDHVASNELERERVEKLGGFIAESGGTLRVNGTLVLTRSIGDHHLAQFLSRTPHVISMTKDEIKGKCHSSPFRDVDDDMPCFIILASDGLWDVFSNQEAVELVALTVRRYGHDLWRDQGAFQEAAEVLTQEAYVRGSTDNIGVCVVAIS